MKLTINISLDNDSFNNGFAEVEVNRIIKKYLPKHDLEIADKTTVLDINGNTCGYIKTT